MRGRRFGFAGVPPSTGRSICAGGSAEDFVVTVCGRWRGCGDGEGAAMERVAIERVAREAEGVGTAAARAREGRGRGEGEGEGGAG